MQQDNVRFTVLVKPKDRSHSCDFYMHHSFYLEQEDAILEALSAWNLDNPYAEGEVFFLGLGFGWDPRTGRPDPRDQEIFRA